MNADASSLLVSGHGLVTCVGFGAADSCASLRAGIIRRAPLLGLEQFDEIDLSAPINGGVVPNLAEGFSAAGVWAALGSFAIRDLLDRAAVQPYARPAFAAETAVLCAGPELDGPRFGWPAPETVTQVGTDLLRQLQDALGLRFHPSSAAIWSGHAGAGDAVVAAAQLLNQGKCARVIMLGVDTLTDGDSVRWLESAGRLKSDDVPIGLCPGEAAGCILLETARSAQSRSASARTMISGCAVLPLESALDPEPFGANRVAAASALGKTLAAAVDRALRQANITLPFAGDVFVDLNGEEWRALGWGYAQVMLGQTVDFARCRVTVPAASFAETGAASGFAGVCAAAEAMVRGYASEPRALVCSLAESGRAAALVVKTRDEG